MTEMGRVYRQARRNEIKSADASRLVHILTQIRGALESSDLEARMAVLEKDKSR